jgi:hypothetical protein
MRETNLPPDAGEDSNRDGLTVDKILAEKKLFDLSVNFEKLATKDELPWSLPCEYHHFMFPTSLNIFKPAETLPNRKDLLFSFLLAKLMQNV